MDFYRLVVIRVILVVRVHVMISLGSRWERERDASRADTNTPQTHDASLTVKVTGVLLRLQMRNKLGFLSDETAPVQITEERVLFHLERSTCTHTQLNTLF